MSAAAEATPLEPTPDEPTPLATPMRRCWRCLHDFPADPDEPAGHPASWWVCDPCHASLLGGRNPR